MERELFDYFVVFDNGIHDKLRRLERMRPDKRIQFDVGVFEFDQFHAQFPLDGFQLRW